MVYAGLIYGLLHRPDGTGELKKINDQLEGGACISRGKIESAVFENNDSVKDLKILT